MADNNRNRPNPRNGGSGNNNNKKNGQMFMYMIVIALVVMFFASMFSTSMSFGNSKEISYSEFIDMVEKGEVESVKIEAYQIDITPVPANENQFSNISYYTARVDDDELVSLLEKYDVDMISMIAPTSKERIAMIAKEAKGFIYVVSSLGVTGVRQEITTDLQTMVEAIRKVTDVPCAIGFGIANQIGRAHV